MKCQSLTFGRMVASFLLPAAFPSAGRPPRRKRAGPARWDAHRDAEAARPRFL